ncbi:MAG: hypothetical protein COU06_00415 [Candidatus Harrisonbacteria bacterium CG10_big_fil_rev_8_21_14_0_10_38_8]|uniref:Methyltransferase type 11 domain-containing protein n=1 Tax=Candidatus Harrisonbacteria bacterium CG10_big_fil_rev_8_21_14_0_10_38_8 TaxID=1974582 RepID=A0A2M6WKL7_9BACT|nr:MAG: hypothetical protein COU06_00415 [Candidatus Harrisonbacteria bacterium CG10_big_fil_rev_8_21_14_0_10_38_8]
MGEVSIRTHSQDFCPVCDRPGQRYYRNLRDDLFEVGGSWNIDKCTDNECGLYWLNPTPHVDDIWKLYIDYSTHNEVFFSVKYTDIFHRFLQAVRDSVLSTKLDYPLKHSSALNKFLYFISRIHPGWVDAQLVNSFYVPWIDNGILLDVGCGSGSSMLTMKNLRWNVVGIDFDKKAVKNARSNGLTVHEGWLTDQKFPDNHFDRIIMNHVIEHISDPVALLAECHRILKPGGVLVAITPNASSWGHYHYRKFWRGLEVPRHIRMFTSNSLICIGQKAGFVKNEGFTTIQGNSYIRRSSHAFRKNNSFDIPSETKKSRIFYHLWLFIDGWLSFIAPASNEVVVLRSRKG